MSVCVWECLSHSWIVFTWFHFFPIARFMFHHNGNAITSNGFHHQIENTINKLASNMKFAFHGISILYATIACERSILPTEFFREHVDQLTDTTNAYWISTISKCTQKTTHSHISIMPMNRATMKFEAIVIFRTFITRLTFMITICRFVRWNMANPCLAICWCVLTIHRLTINTSMLKQPTN